MINTSKTTTRTSSAGKRSGFALLASIGAAFVLGILGLTLATMSIFSVRMSGHRQVSIEAFDIAEAGFRHAAKSLSEDSDYEGENLTKFGLGTFSVAISVPGGQPTHRIVSSTGFVVGSQDRIVHKSVSGLIILEEEDDPGSDYAILADKLLEISGNASINSSPDPSEGHIHSNGKLKVSGNPNVLGEASVVGQYELSGGPSYEGGLHTGAAPVTAPWPNFVDLKAQATAAGVHIGDKVISGSAVVQLKGVITGKLEIKDNAKVEIVGPVWVNGEAILQGNTQIKGDGAIISDQKMVLGGAGGFSNDALIDNRLMFASMVGPEDTVAIDIGGPVRVKAAIFAPNGKINLSGQMDIWGFLRASTVYLSGDTNVTKNTNYSPFYVEPKISAKVQYWQES